VPNHPYFVEVPVIQDIDMEKAIELSGITKEQFLALNPSFTKPVILKELNPSILLPYGKAELFKYNVTKHPRPLSKMDCRQNT
jgi:membrane-bound lytic murein transglycosylase D